MVVPARYPVKVEERVQFSSYPLNLVYRCNRFARRSHKAKALGSTPRYTTQVWLIPMLEVVYKRYISMGNKVNKYKIG